MNRSLRRLLEATLYLSLLLYFFVMVYLNVYMWGPEVMKWWTN